ncbi:hypothetical protein CPC08DRAFT_426554 [Agrocybe pediades]|nr:hypothetical protein CPC08DRAFT_426554 [Agrocybe pediades]
MVVVADCVASHHVTVFSLQMTPYARRSLLVVSTSSLVHLLIVKTISEGLRETSSDLSFKLNLGIKGKVKAPEIVDSGFSMRSVNETSQALSGVLRSGWRRQEQHYRLWHL